MSYTGRQIVMDTMVAHGVEYIFGNPGTTELPIIDSLADYPSIHYILALQEAVAVSMADAYAHASGKVGVVNLHVGPGLGNGLGSVYNAWEGETPLLVTAGQQDTRMRLRGPLLGHDLVAMAAPLVKWSVEAATAAELPLIMSRAFKVAQDAPSGPVFVSLPIDVMDQRTEDPPRSPTGMYVRSGPDPDGLDAAADALVGAGRPVFICGDRVARGAASAALVALAERVGGEVFADVLPALASFPNQHPQYRDRMARDQSAIRQRLEGADVLVMVGAEIFEEVWHVDGDPFPQGCTRIQIESTPTRIAQNYRVDVGLVADIDRTLRELDAAVEVRATAAFRASAAKRRERASTAKERSRTAQTERAATDSGNRPISTATLMAAIARAAPPGVAVAGEAITASADMIRSFDFSAPGDLVGARGGGIGQGLPTAIGMKLAAPDRPVLCLSGDGSAMYTIQALWTAAHHDVPVVFVILNNGAYRILKINLNHYRSVARLESKGYPQMDLADPPIDFIRVAAGLGVQGRRVEAPEAIGPAVADAFASGKPYLLDVLVDGPV